jgi:galactokinase
MAERLPGGESRRISSLATRLHEELGVEPEREVCFASAPGRTELSGNHTDHNGGRVLAASVQLDTLAAVSPREDMRVRLVSEGFPAVDIDLGNLEPHTDERERTAALVRGVAAGLRERGNTIGGFDAALSSTVAAGSGLSSSASVEVLVGTVMDELHNGGRAGPTRVAIAGQHAENTFFGKPSGLMDQLACATGGIIAIDFANETQPRITRVNASFDEAGFALLVVNTGGSHADLTSEYAAIPAEMRAVAAHLGAQTLSGSDEASLLDRLDEVRSAVGDRAVARALHFYAECRRVDRMVAALSAGDFASYIANMADSGRSSGMFLQNCAPASQPDDQAVVVALALTERFFCNAGLRSGHDAACRVHGGGFAGTIQVLLPASHADRYTAAMEGFLGPEAATRLLIRSEGATVVR